jgi:hypothetical protein
LSILLFEGLAEEFGHHSAEGTALPDGADLGLLHQVFGQPEGDPGFLLGRFVFTHKRSLHNLAPKRHVVTFALTFR